MDNLTHSREPDPVKGKASTPCPSGAGCAKLGGVNPMLRPLAVAAAFSASPFLLAGSFTAPVIRLEDPAPPPPSAEASHPPLAFAIPKYVLPATDREALAMCLVFEAASQGDFGMRAVMAVIRNRSRGQPELFVPTIMRARQFSALNKLTAGRETLPRAIARAKRDVMWETALKIVDDATTDKWHDPTHGATHYTRSVERTIWTRSLAKTVTIGAHSFYR